MAAVSVIIPTYNRAAKAARAVSSVLFQTFSDYEVIVVDDGSSDGTREALAPFGRRIRVLSHGENRGVSAARNSGIRASQGSLVAFLDSDDYWFPEKLSTQAAFFESHPEAVACQSEELWVRRGRRVNPMAKHLKPSGDDLRAVPEAVPRQPFRGHAPAEPPRRGGAFRRSAPGL